MMKIGRLKEMVLIAVAMALATTTFAEAPQWVEGFDKVEFFQDRSNTRDFRGTSLGYMTAAWWAPGQMKKNCVSWKTAHVPAKQATTFAFIAATCVLPPEFSRGPAAKLTINGQYALTFTLGVNRDYTWKEGEFELKYISKRVDFPNLTRSRQSALYGNSGVFQFSVPAAAVEAGQPALLKVEIQPFDGWNNGWFMVKERRDALKQTMESLQGEIEALRQDMAILNEQTHILATQVYGNMLGTDRFKHQVIYTNGYRHLHPADLVKLQNGELLLTTREATEHIANDGDVIMLRSRDGGRTWGERQVIAAIKDLDEREGCGIQLRDGTIVMGIYFNGLYDANGRYGGKFKREPGKQYLGAYMITSTDNGHTWSAPNYIDTKGMPFSGGLEGPTDAPIEMPDGSILMGVIGYKLNGDAKNNGCVLLRSEDKGRTWKYLSAIASDPGGKMGGFAEPGLVRTKSGRLVAGLRTPGADNAIFMTTSDDGGKTWAPPRKTELHGHPVDLVQLADGRLMATYGIRPPQHAMPGGIRACFSSDDGETWNPRSEVQLRNDFLSWDVGYPESMEMPDGRVLTVYYYNLFSRYFIGGTFWKP